ncbi:c-type cytochrome, partial [Bordetella bronchiseptica]
QLEVIDHGPHLGLVRDLILLAQTSGGGPGGGGGGGGGRGRGGGGGGGAAAPAPAAAAAAAPAAPAEQQAAVNPAGEKLYKATCFACHATGVANAPKFGDKAAWAPYIQTGMDAMLKVAMQGKGAMPPKGGAATASEDDIRAAIEYMVNAAK